MYCEVMMGDGRQLAKVKKVERHTSELATISFVVDDVPLRHIAGQYITVFFEGSATPEGKAYSLSSAPSDDLSSITVKKVGEFSGRLYDLCVGDEIMISQPYGSFNAYQDETPLVCIAGGTGAAPIHSIIREESLQNTGREIRFLWSNKWLCDAVWDFSQAPYAGHCDVRHFVTRQQDTGRIERRILPSDLKPYARTHCFYVCGTVDFVCTMWQYLAALGVPDYMVSTETFFGERT